MGFDAVSVIECMKGASDEDIVKRAVGENRVLVTNDKYLAGLQNFSSCLASSC
jgi:hypothetical protein